MGGMDENVPVFGDWFTSNSSPRTLFSELIAKEYSSRLISDDFLLKTSRGSFPESKEPGLVNVKNQDSEHGIQFSKEILMELDSYNGPKSATRGGLSERIAGRAGFGNLTLDTSQIRKTTASFTSPTEDDCSTLLTIPPGLSPTTLLDSPIFLYNTPDDLSPSTGRLSFVECDNVPHTNVSSIKNHTTEDSDLPFSFKLPMTYLSCAETKPGLLIHQSNLQNGFTQLFDEKDSGDTLLGKKDSNSNVNDKHTHIDEPQEGGTDQNPIEEFKSISLNSRGEVGFNWRKYGQKKVSNKGVPRSYYKCTYPNCKVTKIVERSHEGHITEITYTGFHNHSNSLSDGEKQIEEKFDHSLLLNDGDVEDEHVPHGSVSLGDDGDGDGDENEFKRRKLDACALEMSAASRAVREPKIVVQTTSEVDILDDGYRWRKYGQKVVKGNPNPRSYYKCTNPGCTVRKHIERASHDLKEVITTYEGKHNHEVPVARSNGQSNSLAPSSNAPTAFPSCFLPKKTEPARMPDALDRFEVPLPLRSFPLPNMEQPIGAAVPNLSFAMANQNMKPSFSMAALGNMSMKMPVLPPFTGYMPQHRPLSGVGFMAPKQAPREELAAEPKLPVFTDSTFYRMLSRMPLGPQL